MTASHTPGPWAIVSPESGGLAVQYAHMTSESRNGGFVSAICPGPDGQANAHLIAAAPELLASLRAMVAYYDVDGSGAAMSWPGGTPVTAVLAAIAKAEGR